MGAKGNEWSQISDKKMKTFILVGSIFADPARKSLLRPIRGVVDGQLPTLGKVKL